MLEEGSHFYYVHLAHSKTPRTFPIPVFEDFATAVQAAVAKKGELEFAGPAWRAQVLHVYQPNHRVQILDLQGNVVG